MSVAFGPRSLPAFFDECDFRRRLHPVSWLRGNGLSLGFMVTVKSNGELLDGSLPGRGGPGVIQGLECGELDQPLIIAPRIPSLGLVEHALRVAGGARGSLLLFGGTGQTFGLLVFKARSFLFVSHEISLTSARIAAPDSSGPS